MEHDTLSLGGDDRTGADPESSAGGRIMVSAGARAYMGVWGLAPSGVQGVSPWSGGQGDEVPLKLTRFLYF